MERAEKVEMTLLVGNSIPFYSIRKAELVIIFVELIIAQNERLYESRNCIRPDFVVVQNAIRLKFRL